MKTFVTIVIGVAELGIIKSLADITRFHGGEWQASKVIKLGGHFLYALIETLLPSSFQRVKLVFDCNDRSGLTRDIDTILADFEVEVEVESLECHRFAVTGLSAAVFSSMLTLAISESMTCERVVASLESLSRIVILQLSALTLHQNC
ncbi:MAG: glycine cleavage system regulatory protein [Shewanella sp.]|jgi:glycine cleavage system regulatory protein